MLETTDPMLNRHTGTRIYALLENSVCFFFQSTHMRDRLVFLIFNGLSIHLFRIQNINIYLLAWFQCYPIIRARARTTYINNK